MRNYTNEENMLTYDDLTGLGYSDPKQTVVLNTPMDMVKEFATKTGQNPDSTLYARLIQEEFNEWLRATILEDFVTDQLKELADLVYVIYGYANARGWKLDDAVKRVHENNLGRCIQPDGTVKRRDDGKILKNKDYPKVKLGDLV